MADERLPTFSIVMETVNLAVVDLAELYVCLDSIAAQDLLDRADGVFLTDGGVVPDRVLEGLRRRYPWLTVMQEAGASYVGLKLAGAMKARSEVIVFCDSDIRCESGWLAALLEGFRARPDADIIAGETTTPISGPYSLAFGLTFNFPRFTGDTELSPTPMYWANNVAVRRDFITRVPLADPKKLYRAQNLVHAVRVHKANGLMLRQPKARSVHAVTPPREIMQRYFRLGRDAVSVRRITARESGSAYLSAMAPDEPGGGVASRIAGRLVQVARTQPTALAHLPLALPCLAMMGAAYVAGRVTGTIARRPESTSASA